MGRLTIKLNKRELVKLVDAYVDCIDKKYSEELVDDQKRAYKLVTSRRFFGIFPPVAKESIDLSDCIEIAESRFHFFSSANNRKQSRERFISKYQKIISNHDAVSCLIDHYEYDKLVSCWY